MPDAREYKRRRERGGAMIWVTKRTARALRAARDDANARRHLEGLPPVKSAQFLEMLLLAIWQRHYDARGGTGPTPAELLAQFDPGAESAVPAVAALAELEFLGRANPNRRRVDRSAEEWQRTRAANAGRLFGGRL